MLKTAAQHSPRSEVGDMAGKFATSWNLMKASAAVLRSDKALMMFPLLSGLCCLLVAASFIIPIAVAAAGMEHVSRDTLPIGWDVGTLAFYLVSYFVIIFFHTGLAG